MYCRMHKPFAEPLVRKCTEIPDDVGLWPDFFQGQR